MTATLKNYGPRQFGNQLGLTEWQFERALRLGLIPATSQDGRWSAAVFNEVVARIGTIREQVGTVPDVGAARAEAHLAERLGITLNPGTAAELARRGHLPVRGNSRATFCTAGSPWSAAPTAARSSGPPAPATCTPERKRPASSGYAMPTSATSSARAC
ncbi:hypothetical protein AB0I22_19845 [Streptomyces sp. NPDC050610]|uniref:hypothetical protein n=1 Tax=Streptomyces sp. NPDC050610 TaxID=3157097 RepID=UPI0034293734